MNQAAQAQKWRYDMAEVSQDKRARRSHVMPGAVPSLVGADMRVPGGLRPHPGFKTVRTLGVGVYDESDNLNAAASLGQTSGDAYDYMALTGGETKEVLEAHAFEIRVGADETMRGWVYRVKDGSNYRFCIEWYDEQGSLNESYWHSSPNTDVWKFKILFTFGTGSENWSIVTRGRLLYVFVKGRTPHRFYIDTTTTAGRYYISDTNSTGPGARPGAPAVTLDFNSWQLLYNGGGGNERPYLEFPYYTPATDFVEASVINWDEADVLEPGWYNFAYLLKDSKTGLRSMLSELFVLPKQEFQERVPYSRDQLWDQSLNGGDGGYTNTIRYRRQGVPQQPTMVVSDIDRDQWDTLQIYRNPRVGAPGSESAGSVLKLDLEVALDPGATEYTHNAFLRDMELVIQPSYFDTDIFLESPPQGGIAFELNGTVFLSDISDTSVEKNQNIGEIRYSSLTQESMEMFPPAQRYVPVQSHDEVIAWFLVSDSLVGLSRSRQFDVVISYPLAVFRENYQGFGITGPHAGLVYGPSAYIVTDSGIKELRVNGQIYAINAFNQLILEEWSASLDGVVGVFDQRMNCLMFLNPTEMEIACLWAETRSASEIHQAPFVFATEGSVPASSDATRRAMFVTGQGIVAVPDSKREKTFTQNSVAGAVGTFQQGMLSQDGDHFFTVVTTGTGFITVTNRSGTSPVFGDMRDCMLYVSSGSAAGSWVQVSYADDGTIYLKGSVPVGLAASDKVVVNPTPFSVMGWALGLHQTDDGFQVGIDKFKLRGVTSVGAAFEVISDAAANGTSEEIFKAKVYKGLETTEQNSGSSGALAEGTGTTYAALAYGGSTDALIFPEVEVICPNLDFVLLAFNVSGKIDSTDTPTRS